ncbi:hypothetical protein [Streptomyces griseocarneus]|uniref:Uncharacterized protein n=1 Tax=Streptomyces griseocarneus TaxID=51201 RepID=A0ABX7RTL2_9ACTN|nr:hypothetical protein [Streptomyces griseocarneus]QSY50818.1 hypothetical protein J3S04_07810 [Streptomyces griseocarneus]
MTDEAGVADSGADGDVGGWVDVEWELGGGVGAGVDALVGERHDTAPDAAGDRGEGTEEDDAPARTRGDWETDADAYADGRPTDEAGAGARVPGQARHEAEAEDGAPGPRTTPSAPPRAPGARGRPGARPSAWRRKAARRSGPGGGPAHGFRPPAGERAGARFHPFPGRPLPHVPGQTRGGATARTPAPAGTGSRWVPWASPRRTAS